MAPLPATSRTPTSATTRAEDPTLRDGGDIAYEHRVEYRYEGRGLQTAWRSPREQQDRRIVRREFHPNTLLRERTARETEGDAEARSYAYAYNDNRSLSEITDRELDRSTRISYDAAERPTFVNEAWTEGRDTVMAYDPDGNVTERRSDSSLSVKGSHEGGKTTAFSYDELSREVEMRVCPQDPNDCSGEAVERRTTTAYYPSGDTKRREKPNRVTEQLSFDTAGRIERMRRENNVGSELKDQPYAYDRNGNRTRDERGTHRYNARDQLIEWTRAEGQSEPEGTTVSYTVNGQGSVIRRVDSAKPRGTLGARSPRPSRSRIRHAEGEAG